MPADFEECLKEPGHRVVTITPKKGKYLRVCYDKNNKPHSGEVRTTKK